MPNPHHPPAPNAPDNAPAIPAAQIQSAADALKNGAVIAIPTDTLYGLAANAFNPAAVEKIFALKGRPAGLALPLLLADPEDIAVCALNPPQDAFALARAFWPGALTLVMRKSPQIPSAVTAGLDTVALRVPNHPIPRAVARALNAPITGTSANISGHPNLTTAQAVRQAFRRSINIIIDGGEAPGGVPSTILDLTAETPRIIRQGAVPQSDIESILNRKIAHI